MYWQKIFSSILIALALFAGGVSLVQAQVTIDNDYCPKNVPGCDINADLIVDGAAQATTVVILKILDGVLKFSAIMAVIMLIYAGAQLVEAHGNQEELQTAHKNITWIVAGLVVIILSLLLVQNFISLVYRSKGIEVVG